MRKALFKAIDAAIIRVSVGDLDDPKTVPWPEGAPRDDPAAWHEFVGKAWASGNFRDAVELASPSLAATVGEILSGDVAAPGKTARAGMALARYKIRFRGRATPFGLFAGATPARIGPPEAGAWGTDHQMAARADGQWLAALVTGLEACGPLRRRLHVTANDLLSVRGDRILVGWLPQASALAQDAPAEISLRRTPAAETALRLARTPATVQALVDLLAERFAPDAPAQADTMVSQLIACGALISELRPPSTAPDPLAWILDTLGELPPDEQTGALRNAHSRLRRAEPADLDGLAAAMRKLAETPSHPIAVDLRPDCQVTVPQWVADEAAAAASALARLSPHPHGPAGWRDYHARFLDRYGPGTVVPIEDLLNPTVGLGSPAHYMRGQPAPTWNSHTERIMALAQQAALDQSHEIVLDDATITEIAGPESAGVRPVPHMDITIELRAASIQEVGAGAFTIVTCGAGRTAMATAGRFLYLLPEEERTRLATVYRDLPTVTRGALAVQMSFPPHHPPAENVTRVPRMLPHLLSVAEHHRQDESDRISFGDLAVTATLSRFHLISMSRRASVEPVLACAPAWHAVPPAARLLFQLPRAHCAPPAVFDWGAAASMPFLPRIRFGRAILSPARWQIRPGDLPGPRAGHGEWTAALARLRDRRCLPDWISAGSGDRQLRLCLDHPMDLALLRAHLDACGGSVVVTESWAPEDHAWCGGCAHEFVIPLAATTTPDPPPKILARRGPLPSVGRGHGHLPGSGSVLSARLYSDPALFDTIVTEQLPDLADGWDDLLLCWFIRYRDPRHHLRLRLHVADYGKAAARIGKWAAALREQGLIGDLVLDTYRPEVGRFGDGPVLGAAEALFAADSAAAAAQLANTSSVDPQALTAASLVDLAGAILGEHDAGLSWLVAHPRPASPESMDRDARRQVLAMTGPDGTAPAVVRTAWRARADAAAAYARLLTGSGRSPAGVIESLLHLHHNRVHGPGQAAESATYRLARAAALAHAAQTAGRGKGCPS